MKNLVTKRNVLWVSGLLSGLLIFFLASILLNFCGSYRYLCKDIYSFLAYAFLPLPFVYILSLITYFMREEIFYAWWNFARWWVPVIIVTTLLLNNAKGGGGYLGMGQDFTMFILGILYTVLVVVSLFKIMWGYARMKDRVNGEVD